MWTRTQDGDRDSAEQDVEGGAGDREQRDRPVDGLSFRVSWC
jgi:hypothetical protein